MKTKRIQLATLLLLALSPATNARAASDVWDGNGANPPNGVWGTDLNWADNTTPGNSDTATFNIANSYTVTFNAEPLAIEAITVSAGHVTLASMRPAIGGMHTLAVNSASGGQDVIVNGGATLTLGKLFQDPVHLIVGDDLEVNNGARLNVNFGSDVTTTDLLVATTGAGTTGTVVVQGPGSSLTRTGATQIALGANGGVADLTFRNNGTGDFNGQLVVSSTGTLNIDGGTFNANGPITMVAGGTINILSGTLNANAGFDNSAGGTLNLRNGDLVVGGGTFMPNAGGNYTINGQTSTDLPHLRFTNGADNTIGSAITIASTNKAKLTVDGGADLSTTGGATVGESSGSLGETFVSGAGSTWANNGTLTVGNAGTGELEITNGGVVTTSSANLGFDVGGNGVVTVSGAGSQLITSGSLVVGRADGFGPVANGQLRVEAGSKVTAQTLSIADFSSVVVDGGTLRFTNYVNAGSNVLVSGAIELPGFRLIALPGGPFVTDYAIQDWFERSILSNQQLTIDGSLDIMAPDFLVRGGTLKASFLDVGETNGTTVGGLTIEDDGVLDVNSLHISNVGTITVNGGTIRLRHYTRDPSATINFNAGTLQIQTTSNLNPGFDNLIQDVFGAFPLITRDRNLTVELTAELTDPTTVDGGVFTVGTLINPHFLQLKTGTFNLTNQVLTIGSSGLFSSLDVNDEMTVNVTLGITNQGLVTGDGQIGGTFANAAAGELRAQAGRSLRLTGSGNTNAGQIKLLGGELEFTQNLTNGAGAFISGNGSLIVTGGLANQGTMNFAGTANIDGAVTNAAGGKIISGGGGATIFYDDVTNNGEIRTSTNGFTVFFGSVSGSGTFTGTGTVNFEGDLSPGSSPASVSFAGDVVFGPEATLQIEMGGTAAGWQYDQINVAGELTLGGTLEISLIDGFIPSAGQTFDILNWGSLAGAFTAVEVPSLPGLAWNTSQLAAGILRVTLPGDFNLDNTVDAADYVVWRKNDGTSNGYNVWRANFGRAAGSGAASGAPAGVPSSVVPEPGSAVLFLVGLLGICLAARRQLASCTAIMFVASIASPSAADYSVSDNVAFNAKKINPYTGGPAWEFGPRTYELLNESFGPVTIGPLNADPLGLALETLFGVDLPHLVKLQTGASLSGQAKVNFGYYVTAGRLDISYPATANLNFETAPGTTNLVLANQLYTVDGGFAPGVSQRTVQPQFLTTQGGAGYATAPLRSQTEYQQPWFETQSPWASAWVEASADVQASIFTKASALGGLKEWRKDIRAGGKVGGRLVEIDPNGLYVAGEEVVGFDLTQPIGPIPIGGGAADLTIRVPNVAVSSVTNGSVQGPVIQAYKEQPLVTLTGNLERLIPFVGTILQNQVGPLGYDLLNLAGGPQLSLYQRMTFTPDPKVRLTFSEPVIIPGRADPTFEAEFDLDDEMNWRPMFSNSDSIQVRPTYLLNNTFRNETGLNVNLVIEVEALSLTGDFPPFNGTLGPVYDDTVTIPIFEGGQLFAPQFNIPLGSVAGGSLPGLGPVTTGGINFEKSNLGIVPGLGDLELVTATTQFQQDPQAPPGYFFYNLQFARSVDGGPPRQYQANVSALGWGITPEGGGEDDVANTLETLQDVIVTDPVTSQQFNLGRHFCVSGCDQSDFLPDSSPAFADPNPNLGRLYVSTQPDDLSFVPNVDLNIAGHPTLDQYNPVNDINPPQNSTIVETTEFIDHAQYPTATVLVRTSDVIPDGIGRFHSANFVALGMNEDGGVAFFSPLKDIPPGTGGNGYYYVDESGKTKLARFGDAAPGGGTIAFHAGLLASPNDLKQGALVADISNSSTTTQGVFRAGPAGLMTIALAGVSHGGTIQNIISPPLVNESGQVLFTALVVDGTLFPKQAVFVGNGSALTEIVRQGNSADGFTAPISSIDATAINDSGQVALFAISENGQQGIYVGDAGSRRPYAISGGPAPQGGQFVALDPPSSLNGAGHVAFTAFYQASPGSFPNLGIFRGEFFETVRIAQAGQLAPNGDGILSQQISFGQMNDAGQVVFRAGIDAVVDYEAILMGNGGSLTQIARHGSIAANGGNPIPAFFGAPLVNNQGHVAFQDYLLPDNVRGVFLFDGTNLVQIMRPGQPLAGGTVRDAGLVDINDDMQVAYWALLTDGRQVIARFEPSIYWRNPGSGNWGSPNNWSLGIGPTNPYDVFITAENALTVTGPFINSTVKSLTVGGEGSANVRLELISGATLTTTNGTTIFPGGILTGFGTLAGSVSNQGIVSPGSALGALQINGDFTQLSAGTLTIEVASATNYDQLLVSDDITLGGSLAVSLRDGFIPAPGQQFSIFGNQADSIMGAFQSFNFPTFNGLTFEVLRIANSLVLQVVESIGDYNHDGVVDAADYIVWRKTDGTQADYNLWRANFGRTAGSGSGAPPTSLGARVPEPSTLAMLLVVLMAALFRQRAAVS